MRWLLVTIALLVTGHFAAYTYVRPVLERTPGTGPGLVGTLLLGYGLAGVAGNFAGGALAARRPRRALRLIAAVLGAVVLLLAPAGGSALASAALLAAWGLAYGGVSVSGQRALTAAAPEAPEAASALFAGVFNAAIALGALVGGRLADGPGPTAALLAGGVLAGLAALTPGRDEQGRPRHRDRPRPRGSLTGPTAPPPPAPRSAPRSARRPCGGCRWR
ncbi:MFS transporter [Streptomyces nogalater]